MTLTQEWALVASLFLKTPHCSTCPYKVEIGCLRTGKTTLECSLGTAPYDKPTSCNAYMDRVAGTQEKT
jgi:hypothetical protein